MTVADFIERHWDTFACPEFGFVALVCFFILVNAIRGK